MNLTASQIASIEAKVAANTQPTPVVLDGKTYSVPYRFAANLKAARRTGNLIGNRGKGLQAAGQLHDQMAEAMGITATTARRIASKIH
jgi:hypothetical protein